jgi:DNA-binding NarL/FixJ family response regulator
MDTPLRPLPDSHQTLIRVIIADDHPIVRNGIAQELAQHPDITVVGVAANGDEALRLIQTLESDVLVLDINMPGTRAVDILRRVESLPQSPLVLILTAHGDLEYILATFKAGVKGYMLKDEDPSMITIAVRAIAQGQTWMSSPVMAKVVNHTVHAEDNLDDPRLSIRENEVLQLLAEGKDNEEIGALLSISERTVRFHLRNVYDKLGVQRRGAAIAWAAQHKQRKANL